MKTNLAPDTTPTSAEVGAEAVAIADGTSTTATVDLTVKDAGAVTIVRGSAKATSEASGPGAYADAGTFGAVEGADLVLTFTRRTGGESDDAALSSSTTRVFALDLPFDFKGGPKVLEFYSEREASPWSLANLSVQGNKAVSDADAEASGGPTHAEAYTDSFAQVGYSDSSAYGHAIVG
jgi:hypothetical protein